MVEPVPRVAAVLSRKDLERPQDDIYREGTALVRAFFPLPGRVPGPSGDLSRGIALLEEVITRHPENWPAHWMLGMSYRARGEHRRSFVAFRAAAAQQSGNADVERELMGACLMVGRFDEGIEVARRAMALSPSDAGLRASLALALLMAGQLVEAETEVERASAADPADRITSLLRHIVLDVKEGRRAQPS